LRRVHPRIAALFQLPDDVIGNSKPLFFSQPVLQAANDLARAP
jgi:hypothetical protein